MYIQKNSDDLIMTKYEKITEVELEITTGKKRKNATNDPVEILIGEHGWELDLPDHDDFEKGKTDVYKLEVPDDMDSSWFRYLCLRKKSNIYKDDDWVFVKLKLTINGKVVYEKDNLNAVLKASQERWCAPDFTYGKAGE